jgi:NTE family protein
MSQQRREEQIELLREQDLLMVPDLEGVAFADFDKMPEAIQRGREIALQHEEQLRAFSVSEERFETYLDGHRHAVTRGETTLEHVVVGEVSVTGVRRVSPKLVAKRVHTQPGEPLDLKVLEEDLERVYQIGEFEQVDFRLQPMGDEYRLLIDAKEKSWGPWYVRIGAALEATFSGTGHFTAIAMLRRPHLNRLGAEWKSWLTLGEVMLIDTEFYQPVEYTGTFFVAPRFVVADNDEEFVYDEEGYQVPVDIDRHAGLLDLGVQFRSYAELRVGAMHGLLKARPKQGTSYESEDIGLGGWRARLVTDRLDNANFPGRGSYIRAQLFASRESLGADVEYERLGLEGSYVAPIGNFRLAGTARFGTGFGGELPFYDDFELGGFLNLSGLERRSLGGDKLAFGRLVLYRKTGEMPGMLGGDFYLGGSLEAGAVWDFDQSTSVEDLQPAASLFAGVDTILGPFYAGWGLTEGGQSTFYIFLGRVFVAGSGRAALR